MSEPKSTVDAAYAWKIEKCSECSRKIDAGARFYYDLLQGADHRTLCDGCGKAIRFHRKRAGQRGEDVPRTIADVDQRMENTT